MSFNVSETKGWVSQYKKIWNEVESQLFEKLATKPIKREGKYVHGKLIMWKERIKTNFHGQDVPFDMYCHATAVLKIDSVYEQVKNYHPQVYVEECIYNDAKNRQCNTWVTKLIIDEQNVAVRTWKKVEYTTSKLYEDKGKA